MEDTLEDCSVRLCKGDSLSNHGETEVEETFSEDVAFVVLGVVGSRGVASTATEGITTSFTGVSIGLIGSSSITTATRSTVVATATTSTSTAVVARFHSGRWTTASVGVAAVVPTSTAGIVVHYGTSTRPCVASTGEMGI